MIRTVPHGVRSRPVRHQNPQRNSHDMRRIGRMAMLLTCGVVLSGVLGIAPASAAWLSPEWNRRIGFSVADGQLTGTGLDGFTLLLTLDDARFGDVFDHADPSGDGLVITAGDGETVLEHEVVSYDVGTRTAELWFQVPTLDDADRAFFLYYEQQALVGGAVSSIESTPGAAWTDAHLAVFHFSEDPSLGILRDWGPNGSDATAAVRYNPLGPGWTSSNLVDGAVGTGWRFDGEDVYAYIDYLASADSSFTVSAWFANSQAVDKGAMAFQSPFGGWSMSFQRTQGDPNGDLETLNGVMSWLPDILDGDPHHFTWTLDAVADTVRFYLDGVERNYWLRYTPPGKPGPVWTDGVIDGRVGIISPAYYNPLDIADGVADEFRLVEGVRSPEWVLTEFRNQSDPVGFYDVSAFQVHSGGPTAVGDPFAGFGAIGAMSVSPNPFSSIAWVGVQTPLSDVTVEVYDLRGRLVRTLGQPDPQGDDLLRFLWDGRDARGTEVGNGTYFIRARSGAAVATTKAVLVR